MKDIKQEIIKIVDEILNKYAEEKSVSLNDISAKDIVEASSEKYDSDFSIVCFKLARYLKISPNQIAEDLNNKLLEYIKEETSLIEFTEVIGGYINMYISPMFYISSVASSFNEKRKDFGKEDKANFEKETILVEYSSPNIAKKFHIGHLKTTVIGQMLYRLYKYLGHNVVSINHLGDYGTQFGKMIEGYMLWKDEYSFDENPIEDLNDIYIRINELCSEDENVLEKCRDNFKKLEQGDEKIVEIWQKFVDLSMHEFERIYEMLNVEFDEIKGEASYSKDLPEVLKLMEEKEILVESEGAKIVEFEEEKLPPCLIVKSNGSTLYITRDIAAALYRIKKYDYDKSLYIVASEQNLHFKQLKEILKMLDIEDKYTEGLIHIPYGMIRLESGKMSTREGNVIKVEELLEEAISRTKKKLDEKDILTEDEKEIVSKQVGVGAVIFSNLSTQLIKDQVFSWENVLNFQGETAPYIQYINVRINSILREAGYKKQVHKIGKYNLFLETEDNIKEVLNLPNLEEETVLKAFKEQYMEDEIELFKTIYEFPYVLKQTGEKREPYILTTYLLNISKQFSEYYSKHKILVEDEKKRNSKIYLIYLISSILEIGLNILGIEIPEKM